MVIKAICPDCQQQKTVETRSAERRYSRITRSICRCGVTVDVKAVYDLDKIVSSHPLPGYDRETVRRRLSEMGLLA